ncbi:MAG: PAS domain-containing protein [Deltaproteobacteria bacterium]|nr:MAG: PAS domain-containing protein [Deltaproteobacteria bacterium]
MSSRASDWPARDDRVERVLLVLMAARLALAIGGLAIGIALDAIGRETPATRWPGFYIAVALCFVATLVYRPFVGRIERPRAFAVINVATDLALVSALVLFSGGKDSVFTFLYVAVGLYAGVLFPGAGALACAAAGTFAYGGVLLLGNRGWLGPGLDAEPFAVLITSWAVHASALLGAAGLSGFLSRELMRTGNALAERTQDLEQLRTLHQRTVESLKSGLLTTDLQGRVTLFNQEAQRITGLTRAAALGRDVEEVLPGLRSLRSGERAAEPGARARMQYAGPGARLLHLGVGAYALRDASGNAEGEVVIFQDVTDVVAMERELRRSERLAAIGELSASIAHEIRNPLAAISGSIQVMQGNRPAKSAESHRLMEIVVREVDRLDRLIGDFLQFARPGEPKIELVPLAELVGEVLAMFEASRPANVAVECDLHEGLGVHADPAQLRQVLWNLLVNAAQAMPDGGVVRIEARPRPGPAPQGKRSSGRMDEKKPFWAEIAVMDQGAGIPRELVDRVFDPFFTTKAGGTGLGLAIVHRVVAEHRGVVRVERRADPFRTAIHLSLPRAEVVS